MVFRRNILIGVVARRGKKYLVVTFVECKKLVLFYSGRQDLMMAQRYPTQYDGIAAAASAFISSLPHTGPSCSITGKIMQTSEISATVANLTWTGPRAISCGFPSHGPQIGADILGSLIPTTRQLRLFIVLV